MVFSTALSMASNVPSTPLRSESGTGGTVGKLPYNGSISDATWEGPGAGVYCKIREGGWAEADRPRRRSRLGAGLGARERVGLAG